MGILITRDSLKVCMILNSYLYKKIVVWVEMISRLKMKYKSVEKLKIYISTSWFFFHCMHFTQAKH